MILTEEQFLSDPNRRSALAALLADPVMEMALEVVRSQELRLSNVTHTNGDLLQWYALMGAKRIGYLEALQNLRWLATVTTNKPAELKQFERPEETVNA